MPKTPREIAREVDEILAKGSSTSPGRSRRASAPRSPGPQSRVRLQHEREREREREKEQEQEHWLEEEIRRGALRIAGGPDRRVRLTDLRREVGEVGRQELDRALRDMSSRGRIALFPLDDPMEIRPQDQRDALDLSGVPQHVLYVSSRDI
jgi:hypothetical protein